MLEHYIAMVEQHCAADISAQILALNTRNRAASAQMDSIWRTVQTVDLLPCHEGFLGFLSYSISASSPYNVVEKYLDTIFRVHHARRPVLRDGVVHAFERINQSDVDHRRYFKAAGTYRLTLPPRLHERLAPLPFSGFNDEGYSYHLYLVMIDDPKGLAGFEAALTRLASDVPSVGGIVSELCDLAISFKQEGRDPGPILDVLAPFKTDNRRGRGVNGPGTGGAVNTCVLFTFRHLGYE